MVRKYRFLCLPGAYGSAKNYRVQLAPFVDKMEEDESAEFIFTEGDVECFPPEKFSEYFGPPPLYRFIRFDGIGESQDMLDKIRDFPEGSNPEELMRELLPKEALQVVKQSIDDAVARLYGIMEREGPFDGILGYSEGATVAATMVLDEKDRFESEGRPRQLKCAIFFAGWPPMLRTGGQLRLALADEVPDLIDVPTCHVVGASDPYLPGSMALYNVSDDSQAVFFDHGKGHTLPRDPQTLQELKDAVLETMTLAEEGSQ